MERKRPNSLGAYLPFPEVTFAVSMKIPWQMLSGTRQKEHKQVQHHSTASVLLPKEQGTRMFSTAEQQRMFLIFLRDGQMEYELLFKENSISQGYFVLYTYSKQARLAFYLMRSVFVHTKIKNISNFPLANAVNACSTTKNEMSGFLLHSWPYRYVWDPLLYQNKSAVLQHNIVYLRKSKNLNARPSHADLHNLVIAGEIVSHLLHISRCFSPSLGIYQYLHIQRSLFPSDTLFKAKYSQTTFTAVKQHMIFRVRLDFQQWICSYRCPENRWLTPASCLTMSAQSPSCSAKPETLQTLCYLISGTVNTLLAL